MSAASGFAVSCGVRLSEVGFAEFHKPQLPFNPGRRLATLDDVVNHYNTVMKLNLTDPEHADLVEYLKSL